jgi:ABC-2 type transport system ATP-binding protein
MNAIEISGLTKRYSVGFLRKTEKTALHDLSLQVQEGEIFGYLGPNGAGKTTTLKLLMGLMYPTSGSAAILGKPVSAPEVKRSIGFLPEQPYFYDYLTARELLEYYAGLSDVPARDRRTRAEAMLSRVGMADAANTQLRKFSKGMLQRVGIAQAIIHDPKLVFLDEPMSGLDPIGRREVRDLIQELNDEGKTVFFSTHILSDAELLCDRVAVLNQGRLRGVGVVAELLADSRGKMEIIWEGPADALQQLSTSAKAAGHAVRAVIEERQTDAAINAVRAAGGRLMSINQVQGTLEEYFLRHIAESSSSGAQPQ